MKPSFQALLVILNIALIFIVIFLISPFNPRNQSTSNFKEINVERINVLNEDGTTVIAIANKQRIAAPRMKGKEYPVEMIERQHFAGMIFFNEEGDEMGGLVFNSGKLSNGKHYGVGHLSFDRYNDNQVINLEYKENIHGLVQSGITFYDRTGDGSFSQNLDLLEEYYYAEPTDARKKEIKEAINQLKAETKLGAERIFLGSRNSVPQLILKDHRGNPRIKLVVDSTDIARIQFIDLAGQVTRELSEE